MRSASSTCPGSPEPMRPATYFTSGEYATTSRSRSRSSLVALYRLQRSWSSIALTWLSRVVPPSLALCPGMRPGVRGSQAAGLYPSVDLGCRDGCVSEQLLNDPQIGAAFQQMGCERMAEGVRVGVDQRRRARRGPTRPQPQASPDVRRGEPASRLREQQRRVTSLQ